MEENPSSRYWKNNRYKFLIIFFGIGVLVSFLVFSLLKSNKEIGLLNIEIDNRDGDIAEYEYNILEEQDLRSDLDDLIDQHQNLLDDYDIQNKDLRAKDSLINQLKNEIENLLNTKKDLKQAREKIASLQSISKKYFAQVDSLLGKTVEQESVIDSLTLENKDIINENENLNEENNNLNQRIDLGSTLEVYDVEIDKLKIGSHGQERKVIKTKNIQVIRCCFKIAANSIAQAESKSVYIQYISPSGKLLQSPSSPEDSIFAGDLTIQATTYDTFNYKNNEIELCVDWERRDVLEKGRYKILFFIEGKLALESSFKLN